MNDEVPYFFVQSQESQTLSLGDAKLTYPTGERGFAVAFNHKDPSLFYRPGEAKKGRRRSGKKTAELHGLGFSNHGLLRFPARLPLWTGAVDGRGFPLRAPEILPTHLYASGSLDFKAKGSPLRVSGVAGYQIAPGSQTSLVDHLGDLFEELGEGETPRELPDGEFLFDGDLSLSIPVLEEVQKLELGRGVARVRGSGLNRRMVIHTLTDENLFEHTSFVSQTGSASWRDMLKPSGQVHVDAIIDTAGEAEVRVTGERLEVSGPFERHDGWSSVIQMPATVAVEDFLMVMGPGRVELSGTLVLPGGFRFPVNGGICNDGDIQINGVTCNDGALVLGGRVSVPAVDAAIGFDVIFVGWPQVGALSQRLRNLGHDRRSRIPTLDELRPGSTVHGYRGSVPRLGVPAEHASRRSALRRHRRQEE